MEKPRIKQIDNQAKITTIESDKDKEIAREIDHDNAVIELGNASIVSFSEILNEPGANACACSHFLLIPTTTSKLGLPMKKTIKKDKRTGKYIKVNSIILLLRLIEGVSRITEYVIIICMGTNNNKEDS